LIREGKSKTFQSS